MERCARVEWVNDGYLDRRSRRHVCAILRPKDGYRAAVHNVRCKARIGSVAVGTLRSVEGRGEGLADDLLRLDVVCDLSCIIRATLEEARPRKVARTSGDEGYVDGAVEDGQLGLVHEAVAKRAARGGQG